MGKKIKFALSIINSPESELKAAGAKSLDEILGNYISLLLISALLSGISIFFLAVLKAIYFDFFLAASIDYMAVLNYSLGLGLSLFFFFIFAGTMLIFLLSVILKMLYSKKGYVLILKIMMCSAMPLLLFGWIPVFGFSFLIWSVYLFLLGIRLS